MRWQQGNRTSAERQNRSFRQKAQTLHWRRRFDIVLILFMLVVLVGLIGCWWSGVLSAELLGVFDDPPIQNLVDDRKQSGQNIYESLPEKLILDAIFHAPDRLIYLSQEGGTLHTYDPATRLWGREQTGFTGDDLIDTDFVQLRSGCGADPLSDYVAQCPDPDTLWAVGKDGTLARRYNGVWDVVVSNSHFEGADGEPVEAEALTTAAVSADQQWLLLGTNGNGVGLYHTQRHVWSVLDDTIQDALPNLTINHIVWWRDSFWIGTSDGLARATPSAGKLEIQAVGSVSGEIVDLDADEQLWVLEHRDCIDTVGDCLWLGSFEQPDSEPTVLIDQQNAYPAVNLTNLHFAQQWGDTLVLAGQVGIYFYDTQMHRWQQLFEDPIHATLAFENGFYFSSGRDVKSVQANGQLRGEWALAAPVQTLLYDNTGELLAFTELGGLYHLSSSDSVATVFAPQQQTAFAPESFTSATAIGDTMLFISPEGALFHNTVTRSYEDLGIDLLPGWMSNADIELLSVGNGVYGLTMSGRNLEIYYAPAAKMIDRDFYVSRDIRTIEPSVVPGPAQAIWRWGAQGIGILGADGDVYQFTNELAQMTHSAEPDLTTPQIVDVAQHNRQLLVATDERVRGYDMQTHRWETLATHEDGERIAEIQLVDGQLLLRSDAARLLALNGEPLIGDAEGFRSTDRALSDALAVGDAYYLAGNGRVERYDSAQRKVERRWQMESDGDVRLIDLIDGQPLALVESRLYLGETAVAPAEGAVQTASIDNNTVWTVRERNGQRYLRGHARDNLNAQTCFFRNPTAGSGVSTVHDALELPSGTLVVATNVGVRFYNPKARSWSAPSSGSLVANRLHVLDDQLLLIAGDPFGSRFEFQFVPLSSIQLPDSCSDDTVSLSGDRQTAQSVAVNEPLGRVAWLDPDSRLIEWDRGDVTTVFNSSASVPTQSQLRRVFDRQRYWLFTTSNALWRYDTELRAWSEIEMEGFSGTVRNINIEQTAGKNTLLVTTATGFFLGEFETDADEVTVADIAYDQEVAGFSAETLLDVQQRDPNDTTWTFVLDDQIRYFDPLSREWQSSESQPSDPNRSFQMLQERAVLVSGDAQSWQIATDAGSHPQRFANYEIEASDQAFALDDEGVVHRLSQDGTLLACSASGETYACDSTYAPFILNEDVLQAFEWQGIVLLASATSVRAFQVESGVEVAISAELANLHTISATYSDNNQLLLYSAAQQQVVIVEDNLQNRVVDAQQFFRDGAGTLWIVRDNQPYYFGGDRFLSAPIDPRLFALTQSTVAGIDSTGVPYRWIDTQFAAATLPLPAEFDANRITWLQAVGDTDWWVLQDGVLAYVTLSRCALPVPTPVVARTQTITATVVPEPTATPTVVDCYETTGSVNLGITDLLSVQADEDGIDLIPSRGAAVRVDLQLNTAASDVVLGEMPVADVWSRLSSNVVTLPNGKEAYDPYVQLQASRTGVVVQRKSGRNDRLASAGAPSTAISTPTFLNVDWLRWDRNTDQFIVQTPSGSLSLSPAEFIRDEALLFEPIEALLAQSAGELYAANQHGVWLHGQDSLALNDPSIRYMPQTLQTPIVAAHGQIVAGMRGFSASRNGLSAQNLQNITIQIGNVSLEEQIRVSQISGEVMVNNSAENAFASRGFIWDLNRRSVAYDDSNLLLQSSVGIQPAQQQLVEFDAGPSNLGHTGTLHDETQIAYLYNESEDRWHRRNDSNRWQPVAQDPFKNRLLIDNATWQWTIVNGALEVDLKGDKHQFAFNTGNLGFNIDQLQTAAAFDNQLFVATDAFLEIDQPARLANLQATRHEPVRSERFDAVRYADRSPQLFSYEAPQIMVWDGASFVPFRGDDPLRNRLIVDTDRLRFTLNNGNVDKELRLDTFDGGETWAEFEFINRQFPFDSVTAIAAFDGNLYVGSEAGLQQYAGSKTGLGDLQTLYDLRDGATRLVAATRIGRPEQDPDRFVVQTRSDCWSQQTSDAFTPCEARNLLARRIRVMNPFWQWVDRPTGRPIGQYHNADGAPEAATITLTDGRFPHDQLVQLSVCNNQLMTLWSNRWITTFDSVTLAIDTQTRNHLPEGEPIKRLICIDRNIPLAGGGSLQKGAYYEDDAGDVYRWDRGGWTAIASDPLQADLKAFADSPPILQTDRYRLRAPIDETPLTFEWYTLQDAWEPLAWAQDAGTEGWYVPTDAWQFAHFVDEQLWAASDAGLITFDYDVRAVTLNPDQLVIVREPEAPCQITDMQSNAAGSWVRCNASSSRVYSGTLTTNRDHDLFTLSERDPFVEFDITQAPYWDWHVTDRANGALGVLSVTWHEEPVQLLTGQFSFDSVNSLSLLITDTLDVATDLGGWYQLPRATAHIEGYERSNLVRNSAEILQVGRTVSDGKPLLCLRSNDGFDRIAIDETIDTATTCPEYAGFDGLWQYETDEGRLLSYAPSGIGGRGSRPLTEGRFGDDRVVGLPIVQAIGETESLRYFLPSAAGVLMLDETLAPTNIHLPPFAGLPDEAVPTAVWLGELANDPAYVGQHSMHVLDTNGVRSTLTNTLDELVGVKIQAIEDGPQDLVRVNWQAGNIRGWTLIERNSIDNSIFTRCENSLQIDLQSFKSFTQRRLEWETPSGWMRITFPPREEVQVFFEELEANHHLLPDNFTLIRPIQYNEQLILIGNNLRDAKKSLQIVDLESLMIESFPENIDLLDKRRACQPVSIGHTVQLDELSQPYQNFYRVFENSTLSPAERGAIYMFTAPHVLNLAPMTPPDLVEALSPEGIMENASATEKSFWRLSRNIFALNQIATNEERLQAGTFFAEQSYRLGLETNEPELVVHSLNQLSLGYWQANKHDEAAEASKRANRTYAASTTTEFEGGTEEAAIISELMVHIENWDYERALATVNNGIDTAQRNQLIEQEASLHMLKGMVQMMEGRFQNSLISFHEASNLSVKTGNPLQAITALEYLRAMYQMLGERTLADQVVEDTQTISQMMGDCFLKLTTLNNASVSEMTLFNDINIDVSVKLTSEELRTQIISLDKALTFLTTEDEDCPLHDMPAEVRDIWVIGLHDAKAQLYIQQESYDLAIEQYEQALAIIITATSESSFTFSVSVLNNYFNLLVTLPQPQPDKARELIELDSDNDWRFTIADKLPVDNINLGLLLEAEGDIELAIDFYYEAADEFERIYSNLEAESLKGSLADSFIDVHERLVILLWETGQYEAAFEVMEQARGRAFLDLFANRNISRYGGEGAEDELLELQRLYSQRSELVANGKSTIETNETIQGLIEKIRVLSPRVVALIDPIPPSLETIQNHLDPDTTLLSYFVTDDTTFAFLITQDRFDAVALDIEADELASIINDIININAPRNGAEFTIDDTRSRAAYERLISPLPDIDTTYLTIVPHQQLHYLPFAALKGENGWLAEQYTLSTLPSASTLLYTELADREEADNKILTIGNPRTPAKNPIYLSPLEGAKDEAEAIAALFDTSAWSGTAATETRFRNDAANHQILHVAAHGRYDRFAPLLSTLYLAEDETNDGYLEAHEIYELDISAELVVLSACETQVSDELSIGDELTALNRAFLYAGADAVIGTLWQVDDKSSSLLMQVFYQELANEGTDFATALQRAQAYVREEYPDPYHWAGYVLTSNGSLTQSRSPWQIFNNLFSRQE